MSTRTSHTILAPQKLSEIWTRVVLFVGPLNRIIHDTVNPLPSSYAVRCHDGRHDGRIAPRSCPPCPPCLPCPPGPHPSETPPSPPFSPVKLPPPPFIISSSSPTPPPCHPTPAGDSRLAGPTPGESMQRAKDKRQSISKQNHNAMDGREQQKKNTQEKAKKKNLEAGEKGLLWRRRRAEFPPIKICPLRIEEKNVFQKKREEKSRVAFCVESRWYKARRRRSVFRENKRRVENHKKVISCVVF